MRFRERAREIDAWQLSEPLTTTRGETLAKAGDWIVVSDGRQMIYGSDVFSAGYEPVLTDNPMLKELES